ncbi:hypothetical protein [Mycobacterium szulgai]|uniref:hypothetical protein n=1 Tax=Mycobacterium szulgai TaxID=1787 RepID=UPI00146FBCE6|nr:hypothetical protein [Mycobacterium szulgai]
MSSLITIGLLAVKMGRPNAFRSGYVDGAWSPHGSDLIQHAENGRGVRSNDEND